MSQILINQTRFCLRFSKSIRIYFHFSRSSRVSMNAHALRMEFPNSSFTVTVLVAAAAEKGAREPSLFPVPSPPHVSEFHTWVLHCCQKEDREISALRFITATKHCRERESRDFDLQTLGRDNRKWKGCKGRWST